MTTIERITVLAEPLRAPTFVAAAEFVLQLEKPVLTETGCYRGCDADGQSTSILSLLARETGGSFASFELHQHNIDKALLHLKQLDLDGFVTFTCGDSAETLKQIVRPVSFAYLDSYDYEEAKAQDAQNHQLKEVEILLPKMAEKSAFLLDDCDLPHGGKAGLSVPKILEAGYKETMTQYQRLFIRA